MSDILTSRNVFFHWNTATNPSSYTQAHHTTFPADVCIVREISYTDLTPGTGKGLYFIWCSLKNNYIGSFTVTENSYNTYSSFQQGESYFVSNPQTVLTQVSNAPTQISFRIDTLVNGVYTPQTLLNGNLNLQVDFIK